MMVVWLNCWNDRIDAILAGVCKQKIDSFSAKQGEFMKGSHLRKWCWNRGIRKWKDFVS